MSMPASDPLRGRALHTTSHVRAANAVQIVRLLRERGAMSRAELVRASGLTKPTVMAIVRSLLDDGIAIESGTRTGAERGGRPGSLLWFNSEARTAVAVQIGLELELIHVTADGTVLAQHSVAPPLGPGLPPATHGGRDPESRRCLAGLRGARGARLHRPPRRHRDLRAPRLGSGADAGRDRGRPRRARRPAQPPGRHRGRRDHRRPVRAARRCRARLPPLRHRSGHPLARASAGGCGRRGGRARSLPGLERPAVPLRASWLPRDHRRRLGDPRPGGSRVRAREPRGARGTARSADRRRAGSPPPRASAPLRPGSSTFSTPRS